MNRLAVGGTLTIVLLLLYLVAVANSIQYSFACVIDPTTNICPPLNTNIATFLQTIGALVAAVVVSQLSVTKPGDAVGASLVADDASPGQRSATDAIASIYVLVWILSGAALLCAAWFRPAVPEVVGAGKEWLGFAIAAAYAYFGISAPK